MKMYRGILILVVSQFLLVHCAEDNIFCDERFTVISELKDTACVAGEYLVPDKEKSECLYVCKSVAAPNIPCDEDGCPPGYNCVDDGFDTYCELNKESCAKYYTVYDKYNEEYRKAYSKPKCLKDGTYAPVQCKGEMANGRCFCYDELGNRIFGQQFSTQSENMTCACSRHRVKMEADPNNWFVSLHCDGEGNYEPLQCNMMDEMCWCAESKTGEVTSQIVPESMMTYLPCYDKILNGNFYLRQCESFLFAQIKVARILRIHGTLEANYAHVMCDADGSYGTYSLKSGLASCTWRDNSPIESFRSEEKYEEMDCNCARDRKIIPDQPLHCLANGNYERYQKLGTEYICVDADGFQNSADRFTEKTKEKCNSML